MQEYELLYIIAGSKSEAEVTKVTDEFGAALLKHGGKVPDEAPAADDSSESGRRKLAYPIDGNDHGWYVITRFSIGPEKLAELHQTLTIHPDILRTVLLRASEVPSAEEKAKARQAAEAAAAEDEAAGRKPSRTDKPSGVKTTTVEVPEELQTKPVAKPEAKEAPVKKLEATAKTATAKPAAKEKPEDAKARQLKLDESLGEILKDE